MHGFVSASRKFVGRPEYSPFINEHDHTALSAVFYKACNMTHPGFAEYYTKMNFRDTKTVFIMEDINANEGNDLNFSEWLLVDDPDFKRQFNFRIQTFGRGSYDLSGIQFKYINSHQNLIAYIESKFNEDPVKYLTDVCLDIIGGDKSGSGQLELEWVISKYPLNSLKIPIYYNKCPRTKKHIIVVARDSSIIDRKYIGGPPFWSHRLAGYYEIIRDSISGDEYPNGRPEVPEWQDEREVKEITELIGKHDMPIHHLFTYFGKVEQLVFLENNIPELLEIKDVCGFDINTLHAEALKHFTPIKDISPILLAIRSRRRNLFHTKHFKRYVAKMFDVKMTDLSFSFK